MSNKTIGEMRWFQLLEKGVKAYDKALRHILLDKETNWKYDNPLQAQAQWQAQWDEDRSSFPIEANGWIEIDEKGREVIRLPFPEKDFDPKDIEYNSSPKGITNYFLRYPSNRNALKAYVNELNKKGKLKQNEINFEKTMLNFEKMFGNLFDFGKGNEVMKYPIDSPNNPCYKEKPLSFDLTKKDKEGFTPDKIPFGVNSISGIASYFCKNPKDRAALKSHVDEMRQKGLLSQLEITNLKKMRNYSQIYGNLFD